MICKEQEKIIYLAALRHWGIKTQTEIAQGEMGELTAAITQHFVQGKTPQSCVIEEIADVEIMAGQMRAYFGDRLIDEAKQKKLERLSGILKGHVRHPHFKESQGSAGEMGDVEHPHG